MARRLLGTPGALTATIISEIRFHDLRHTHATMLLLRGVHPKVVQERLGHTNVGITLAIGDADRGDLLLRESQRFRGYFGQGLIGAGVTSTFKGVIEVNQAMIGLIGHTREELARRSRADLTHPDDVAADVAQFDRVMAGKIDGYRLEKRFIHKGGRAVDVDLSARAGLARQRPIDRPPMSIEAARGHNHGRMGANRGGP